MIRYLFPQGTPEWIAVRLGKVTGSGFDSILTPKELKPSKAAAKYMATLIAETVLGAPVDETESEWMTRGTFLEAEARARYGWLRNVDPEEVGFIARDDERVGCSPDSLIGEDGGLEIKCPKVDNHIAYLLNPASLVAEYRGQVQAGLLITGRAWWDLMSYNPAFPEVIVRVLPDPAYQKAIVPALDDFLVQLDAALARIQPEVYARRAANPFA